MLQCFPKFYINFLQIQNQKNSEGEQFVPRPVIHPEELGLKPVVCNTEVLEKCGSMIYEMYDADDKEKMVK